MPIFKRNNQKVHFVHIPKTGGKSIRRMFNESGWSEIKPPKMITNEKPGHNLHMPYSHWSLWEESSNCDFEFTITRNPIDRASSLIEMHLRHFLEVLKDRAWSTGGGNTPEMRDFLLEIGLLPETGYTEAQIISGIYNIVIPNDPEIVQAVADQNGVSRDAYVYQIAKNHEYVSKMIAVREVEKYFGRQFEQITWIDLLTMYFDQDDVQNYERPALSPCPIHKYVSSKTYTYKFEEYDSAIDDLVSRGFVNENTRNCHENRHPKTQIFKASSWSDNPEVRDTFFDVYGPDFDRFGYDRSTPFPGMK